ncbi:zinc-ribbon domain-containing protein [Leptolyngbya sp. PCC 6406]|uniref:zinc-ribbon domain-containing protein n=1 Tax=Leptolyngbya sp. PCC 6406 TaxID=1173264 RepID=UPI0009DE902E
MTKESVPEEDCPKREVIYSKQQNISFLFCPSCGYRVLERDRFCTSCGHSLF